MPTLTNNRSSVVALKMKREDSVHVYRGRPPGTWQHRARIHRGDPGLGDFGRSAALVVLLPRPERQRLPIRKLGVPRWASPEVVHRYFGAGA